MITGTWTWEDIRNFEGNPSGYQRAQLAWMLVLAAALVFVTVLLGYSPTKRNGHVHPFSRFFCPFLFGR